MTKEENTNIEEGLKKLIGDDGELSIYYGGFEIVVNDKAGLRWAELFDYTLNYGFNVYVGLKNGKLNIIIKQNW